MAAHSIMASYDVLAPRNLALMHEVYVAACRVESELPDTHAATIAARRLIAAFMCKLDDDPCWLRHITPLGTA
jgi:hypothetical protein